MAEKRIDSAESGNMAGAVTDYSVAPQQTDGQEINGSTWDNPEWTQYFGYYKTIPELRAVIDAKATWTVGKGFEASDLNTYYLNSLPGWGKDTFNTILENLIRTMQIGGDAFAEIIRDELGELINLKPIDPSSIKIEANSQGMIDKYIQTSKSKKPDRTIKVEDMFHLARNRVADEIHGVSLVETLAWVIIAKQEVQVAMKTLMQRHVKPVMIYHLDTDDSTEIATFKTKMDKINADGENLYIPKDVVVPEVLAVAPNATLNPLPWLEYLNNQFYQTSGVPQIILGGSAEFTEATAKIAYLAFQQTVEEDQLFIEEQMGKQLGIEIKLEFPASLENELLSDQAKDKTSGATQPNDTTAGVGK